MARPFLQPRLSNLKNQVPSEPAMPLVTQYLTPLLFLGGLGFTIYGLFLRIKS